jgi:hypothetical protein
MVSSASAASTRKYRREAMKVESILRQKGTAVTTIAPEATVKRAADWLRAKNIGSLVVTSGDSILGVSRTDFRCWRDSKHSMEG